MNVLDMHIFIDQAVNKIDSEVYDNIIYQEKDFALNYAMQSYINSMYLPGNKYKTGVEGNTKRMDDLHHLIELYQDTPIRYDNERQIFQIPSDYMIRRDLDLKCHVNGCGDITITNVSNSDWITCVPFNVSFQDQHVPGFDFTGLSITNSTINTSSPNKLLSSTLQGKLQYYSYPGDYLNLMHDIVDDINGQTYDVAVTAYFERYKDIYKPNNIILVTESDIGTATISSSIHEFSDTADAEQNSFTTYELSDGVDKYPNVRIVESDDVRKMLNHPFKKTRITSPLVTFRNGIYELWHTSSFAVKSIELRYFRYPRRISLNDGQDCELPEHTHEQVCNNAVNWIMSNIQHPGYKLKQAETQTFE